MRLSVLIRAPGLMLAVCGVATRAPAQSPTAAQSSTTSQTAQAPQPTFTPDRPTGTYAAGERVGWTVTVPRGPRAVAYTYTVHRDGGTVVGSGPLDLRGGRARIETTSTEPAMLLVEVRPAKPDSNFGDRSTGGPGRVLLGAAVAPGGIRAAEPAPADFDAFWAAKLRMLDSVPVAAVVTAGDGGRAGVEYATVRLDNVNGSHVYGQLARPARAGKFPALLIYQWASPPYPLQKAWVTDRGRPDWDGRTLVVTGTSMGGQQSFAVAGLNPRVTGLVVNVPAGADVTAALHGRGASYPNWNVRRPNVLTTARYFDAANFGAHITARSLVALGYIDEIARPTGIWAVFNAMHGTKEAAPMTESPHNNLASPREQLPWTERSPAWLAALAHGTEPAPAGTGRATGSATGSAPPP